MIEQREYRYHLAQIKTLLAYLKQDLEKYGSNPKATTYGLKVKGKTIEILTSFIVSCQVYIGELLACPPLPAGPLHLYHYPADQDMKKMFGANYLMVKYYKGLVEYDEGLDKLKAENLI